MTKTKKLYLMRLRDHLQMLKRRRAATNAAMTRKGFTLARIEALCTLTEQIHFMEAWISEVKK